MTHFDRMDMLLDQPDGSAVGCGLDPLKDEFPPPTLSVEEEMSLLWGLAPERTMTVPPALFGAGKVSVTRSFAFGTVARRRASRFSSPLRCDQRFEEVDVDPIAGVVSALPRPICVQTTKIDSSAATWTGAQGRTVKFPGREFHLDFSFVGSASDDPKNAAIIDLALEVADRAEEDGNASQAFTSYADMTPGERRGLLEWINSGRKAADAPRSYVLLFLHALECRIVRDEHRDELSEVRECLRMLIELRASDKWLAHRARELLTVCQWLDPEVCPALIHASADTNYRDEIPFDVRWSLGTMLQSSPRLEADPALLLLLQQPRTRLKPAAAQSFRELHALWSYSYPFRAQPISDFPAEIPRLSLTYQPLFGDFAATWSSDLPDIAAVKPPSWMHELLEESLAAIEPLAALPAGVRTMDWALKGPERPAAAPELQLRAEAKARLDARISGTGLLLVNVGDLLQELFDCSRPKAGKLIPDALVKKTIHALTALDYGFAPDPRFLVPNWLRPEDTVALFREEPLPFEPPTDAYLLAQTAVILSALARNYFPSIPRLQLEDIEARLPFRYRFSDRELRRLEGMQKALEARGRSRELLKSWLRRNKRSRPQVDVAIAFGIAFRGEQKNPCVRRYAEAVRKEEGKAQERALELLKAAVESRPEAPVTWHHQPLQQIVHQLGGEVAASAASPILVADLEDTEGEKLEIPHGWDLNGLDQKDAEILVALAKKRRTRVELVELAKARRITVAGAIDRINEWTETKLGLSAIAEGEPLALTAEALKLIEGRIGGTE